MCGSAQLRRTTSLWHQNDLCLSLYLESLGNRSIGWRNAIDESMGGRLSDVGTVVAPYRSDTLHIFNRLHDGTFNLADLKGSFTNVQPHMKSTLTDVLRLGSSRIVVFLVVCWLLACSASAISVLGQSADFELAPINYLDEPVNDPVAKLAERLVSGESKLTWDEDRGYLPAVLKALDIPVSSQTLVFSKTSLQLHRISPRTPRAVYFNDDVYIGWCQNGEVVELASTDPQQGAIFYTIAQERK